MCKDRCSKVWEELHRIYSPTAISTSYLLKRSGRCWPAVDETAHHEEVLATGESGTVYLCHPFLVHAAQPHRGTRPRFMAQPPLLPSGSLSLHRASLDYSPVEMAIRQALDLAAT